MYVSTRLRFLMVSLVAASKINVISCQNYVSEKRGSMLIHTKTESLQHFYLFRTFYYFYSAVPFMKFKKC